MHFTNAIAAASLLAVSAHAWQPSSTNGTDKLAHQGLANLKRHHAALNSTTSCDIGSAAVRKEWLSLSDDEKIAYIDAVKCLQEKPSLSGSEAPGAVSRFDDFVAIHINQTFFIHATVRALSCLSAFQLLTFSRATSYLGTATSRGLGKLRCARSADMKDISRMSTGASTRTTLLARHFSTAVRLPLAETESMFLTMVLVSPPTTIPLSTSRRVMDLAASPPAPSRT